jgi:hypothetical protein
MAGLTHPIDKIVVSCQHRWGEGGRTTPYKYTMTAAELNSKVTQQKFCVAEIALHVWGWDVRMKTSSLPRIDKTVGKLLTIYNR